MLRTAFHRRAGAVRRLSYTPPRVDLSKLTTQPKPVEFPPSGRRLYFAISVFAFAYAASELYLFAQSSDHVQDMVRKARSGEAFFPASQVTRALLELRLFAGEHHRDDETFGGGSGSGGGSVTLGPSQIPRIMRDGGGREAICRALQSDNDNVANAGAELAQAVSSASPHAARQLMQQNNGDDAAFPRALIGALSRAVQVNSKPAQTALDVHNADVVLPNLLSTLAHCIDYYPVGRNEELDAQLRAALSQLGEQAAAAAQRHIDGHDTTGDGGMPHFESFSHFLDESAALNHQGWLLYIALKSPPTSPWATDFVQRYERFLPQHEVFETDKQQLLYVLLLMDHWHEQKVTAHAALPEEREFLFKTPRRRRLLRDFLTHEDLVTDGVAALFFGQVWGTLRTIWALRNVAPPAGEASSSALMWRWKLGGRFGLTAGLGAFVLTMLWRTVRHESSVESDRAQAAVFATKLTGSLFVLGFLFRLCPYFLLPALMVDSATMDDGNGGPVERGTQYVWELSPFGSNQPRRGKPGGDGSEWT